VPQQDGRDSGRLCGLVLGQPAQFVTVNAATGHRSDRPGPVLRSEFRGERGRCGRAPGVIPQKSRADRRARLVEHEQTGTCPLPASRTTTLTDWAEESIPATRVISYPGHVRRILCR
jgi:hypothetical protein